MPVEAQKNLLGLDLQELSGLVENLGQPPYRGKQLFAAIYSQRMTAIDQITTLPLPLREQLKNAGYTIDYPEVEKQFSSVDGTIRYLLRFEDGQSVETVWMPEGDGGDEG